MMPFRYNSFMEHHLTLGAHLLLWVFPSILTVLVVGVAALEGRHRGDSR